MINAGVSIVEAVSDIGTSIPNPEFKKVLHSIASDIKQGSSFSDALRKHGKVFDRFFVSMIKSGEESGSLDLVMNDLAIYLEKGMKLRGRVKSASMYPAFVGVFFLAVVAGMVFFLIPKFKKLFLSIGTDLPLPTKMVMNVSEVAVRNAPVVILLMVGAVIFIVFALKTRSGRLIYDRVLLKIPIFGILITKVILARFFQTLATLLKSGVDIVASLEIAGRVVNSIPVEKMVENIRLRVMEGSSLAVEMVNYRFFPRMAVTMVSVGEKSGRVDELLTKISEFFTEEVDATVEGLSAIIEPIMIVFLGFIVGIFIVAMYLPVFKMASGMMGGL
jgi:type IV pilus assembly protein PilC